MLGNHQEHFLAQQRGNRASDECIKQTSGGRNLWKVQLGQTENYVVFFKQEVTLSEKPTDRFLLNMSPKPSLRVRRLTGRRLEVTFPNGCPAHFKLPVARGCGSAWVKWRGLEEACGGDKKPLMQPLFAVFDQRDLRSDVRQVLKEKGFTIPLFLANEQRGLDTAWMKGDDGIGLDSPPRELLLPEAWEGGDSPKKATENEEQPPSVVRKTRIIQRFGEGIPEGCTFKLSLTNDYLAKDDPDLPQVDRKILSSIKRTRTNPNIFQYMCEEKLASDAAYRSEMVEMIMSHSHSNVVAPPEARSYEWKNRFGSPQKPSGDVRRDSAKCPKRLVNDRFATANRREANLRPFHYLSDPQKLPTPSLLQSRSKIFGRSLSSDSLAGVPHQEKEILVPSWSEPNLSELNFQRREELPCPLMKEGRGDGCVEQSMYQKKPLVVKKGKKRFPKLGVFK